MQARLSLQPIYGWGWVGTPPNPTRETPAPFELLLTRSEHGKWEGVVQTCGHEFEGEAVSLSQRHADWDGCVNVTVGADQAPLTQGWAMVADHETLDAKGKDR